MRAKKSLNTQHAYASAWKQFCLWCQAAGCESLPTTPQTLQDFASWSVAHGYRLQTVTLRMSAIAHYHRESGFASPYNKAVQEFIINARRDARERPAGKAAITYEMLLGMMPHFPDNGVGVRNRSMILLAFASGWRRSEIVALRYRDVEFVEKGLELWLGASKTDQLGTGRLIGIEPGTRPQTCPLLALRQWLAVRGAWQGPLFVRFAPGHRITKEGLEPRGEVLHLALQEAIRRIGREAGRFGAHSLRAGMITEAAKHGASESAIMQRTGHKCREMLQRYIRPATVFEFNPLAGVL